MNRTNSHIERNHPITRTRPVRRHTESIIQCSRLDEITGILTEYGIDGDFEAGLFCRLLTDNQRGELCRRLLQLLSPQVFPNERMLIFRILVCAQYPGIRELLFAEFERSDCDNRWQIGDMLYETADRSCFRRYSEISADARYGSDRQMIVLIFGKLRLYEAKPLLVALLDDETVYGHALDSLSRICDEGDICHFQRFADSGQIWVRKTARKFLRRYGVSESDALSVPLCIKR